MEENQSEKLLDCTVDIDKIINISLELQDLTIVPNGVSGDSARKVVALGLERGSVKIQLVPEKGRISRKHKNVKYGTTIVKECQVSSILNKNNFIYCTLFLSYATPNKLSSFFYLSRHW